MTVTTTRGPQLDGLYTVHVTGAEYVAYAANPGGGASPALDVLVPVTGDDLKVDDRSAGGGVVGVCVFEWDYEPDLPSLTFRLNAATYAALQEAIS